MRSPKIIYPRHIHLLDLSLEIRTEFIGVKEREGDTYSSKTSSLQIEFDLAEHDILLFLLINHNKYLTFRGKIDFHAE